MRESSGVAETTVRSASLLPAVFDAIDVAVIVTDPVGQILLWNAGAEELYGWPAAEVSGRSVVDVLAPVDELTVNIADLESVAAGQVRTGDRRVRRRDGTIVRVQTHTCTVTDDAGTTIALVGTSLDVTGRRVAEQRTRDLAEHFQAALRAGGLGTWRWDMASGTTVWDERLEALFGLPSGGFDGTFETYVSLLHPDDRDDVLREVEQAVETQSSYRVEHRVVLPNGSIRWIEGVGNVTVDEFGAVTGTVGCSMDITDRIERELERAQLSAAAVEAAERERAQRERLEFLAAINDAINAASTVGDIMASVTRAAVPRLGDWCSIHVLPADSGSPIPEVEIAHVDPAMVEFARELLERFPYDPDDPAGVPAVIRTGKTEFYPEISDTVIESLELEDELRDVVERLQLRSSIVVALRKRRRIMGAIQFVRSGDGVPYTDDDVALAEAVAGRLASSIENLRLHERQREIAHTLQQSLLPAALPAIEGLDIAVRYWAAGGASEVGGDFYDVFAVDDDRWAIVIGDVCGTGPAAAATTALARHTVRDSAWHGDAPEQVLRSLNAAVRRSGSPTFVTSVYATIELARSEPTLTVACGGHPRPILVSSGTATAVGARGTLLGAFDDVRVEPVEVRLQRGDVIVLFTDGATDVPPPHALDPDQMVALVGESVRCGDPARTAADRIQAALDSVLSFKQRSDDIALVVVRVE